MSERKCIHCNNAGYIPQQEGIPSQMCPHCEIGQAVIKGYNHARDIGIQASDTLRAAMQADLDLMGKQIEEQNKKIKRLTQYRDYVETRISENILPKIYDEWDKVVVKLAKDLEQALKENED